MNVFADKATDIALNQAGMLSDKDEIYTKMPMRFKSGNFRRYFTARTSWPENSLAFINNDNAICRKGKTDFLTVVLGYQAACCSIILRKEESYESQCANS